MACGSMSKFAVRALFDFLFGKRQGEEEGDTTGDPPVKKRPRIIVVHGHSGFPSTAIPDSVIRAIVEIDGVLGKGKDVIIDVGVVMGRDRPSFSDGLRNNQPSRRTDWLMHGEM